METNVIDIVSYMKDLYAFQNRITGNEKEEADEQVKSPYSFFNSKYRDLASRWYKMKYMNPIVEQT